MISLPPVRVSKRKRFRALNLGTPGLMKPEAIFILDDEPEEVRLLSDAVETLGIPTSGYTSARRLYNDFHFLNSNVVLVLDLHLPDVDGIEVMRDLAVLESPPALVLISGKGERVLRAAEKLGEIKHLNVLASLHKPFSARGFARMIAGLTEDCRVDNPGVNIRELIVRIDAKELEKSIDDGQLELYYQPQVVIATGAVYGVEALVRWKNPRFTDVPTKDFITIVESHSLMPSLTRWVLHEAMQQAHEWQQVGLDLALSVNVSAKDVISLNFPEELSDIREKYQSNATKLTLEITESSLMGELATSLDIMTRLRLKEIGVSIDDFGTGYSSLSLLHRVPFDQLKIDRSFVRDIADDQEARAIVKTCVVLGHELKMQVVAEGVENQTQWNLLQQSGCDLAQGFFIKPPVSSKDMTKYLLGH